MARGSQRGMRARRPARRRRAAGRAAACRRCCVLAAARSRLSGATRQVSPIAADTAATALPGDAPGRAGQRRAARNVHGGADHAPHVLGLPARVQRLVDRPAAEFRHHVVAREGVGVRLAEVLAIRCQKTVNRMRPVSRAADRTSGRRTGAHAPAAGTAGRGGTDRDRWVHWVQRRGVVPQYRLVDILDVRGRPGHRAAAPVRGWTRPSAKARRGPHHRAGRSVVPGRGRFPSPAGCRRVPRSGPSRKHSE